MNVTLLYILSFLLSFLFCTAITAWLIPRLRAMKMGQRILEIGPVWHAKKEGTPTMGGIAFLISSMLCALLLTPLVVKAVPTRDVHLLFTSLLFCLSNGAIGIVDDLTKLRHHRNEGLTPTQKLILQTTFAAAYLAILRIGGYLTEALRLPFFGEIPLGFATYFVLIILILGIVNCANLTDGIDGLATSVAAIIFAFYALLAARTQAFAPAALSTLFLGCALSFFFFNRHPAKIFMGDTGSLLLGAGVVSVAILLGGHLLPIICGIVYVVEGASVILQVAYYKATHKRLFLMAPIHHHLEKCGWHENKIVLFFSALTLLACILCWFLP
jgi:phospho-N-acetylmuramoyl-pentapeptide-transferase